MTNSRKTMKFKNTLHSGTSIFQAQIDVEKSSKMSFLNENVEFQLLCRCLEDKRRGTRETFHGLTLVQHYLTLSGCRGIFSYWVNFMPFFMNGAKMFEKMSQKFACNLNFGIERLCWNVKGWEKGLQLIYVLQIMDFVDFWYLLAKI